MRTAKSKVAILTYHRHDNYGAVLQCYALQQALEQLGTDAQVLDYRCQVDLRPWSSEAIRARGLLPCMFSIAGQALRLPRRKAFRSFLTKLRLTQPYTRMNVAQAEQDFDCFVVGSDNVWKTDITGFDTTYLLDFVRDKRKCNSYAASMGGDSLTPEKQQVFQEMLRSYYQLYVREEKTAAELSALLDRDVQTVLDPTMLLTKEQWESLIIRPPEGKKYLLAYQMVPNRAFVRFAQAQAKLHGCELIFVPFAQGVLPLPGKQRCALGPEAWLGLIHDAEYVVTDSFHGCVFSILFEKRFAVKITQLGGRLESLLTRLGLMERMVTDDAAFDMDCQIDYDGVMDRLKALRVDSLRALETILQE